MAHLGPLPDAPRGVKIRFIGQISGSRWVNVMHMQWTTGAPVQTSMQLLADGAKAAWTTWFAPIVHSSVALQIVEATDISSRTGLQATNNAGATGGLAGTAAPNQVAMVISWKVAQRYRGGHSRSYLPGPTTADIVNGNTWTGTKLTAVNTAALGFRNAMNAIVIPEGPTTFGTYSYFQKVGGAEAYRTPPVFYACTSAQFHTRVDTMRRRLGKELA